MSNVPIQKFKYVKPEFEKGKQIVKLVRTDRMFAFLQVIKNGGETNLHSHLHLDGFWMVLRGRARFYGEGDEVIGEFGQHEGIVIPRGSKYWFESASDEDLELLQVESSDIVMPDTSKPWDRVDHAPANPNSVAGRHVMHEGAKS